MFDKIANSQVPISDLIARRWSGRAFDADKRISRAQLVALLEAARWAPSCYGDEPWRYIIWDKYIDANGWTKAYECLAEGNQVWAKNAPILMLALAGSTFARNGKPNRWGQYDTGAASENLCLQATAMGLMVHQMGGFDADKVRASFEVPEQYGCMAMIAIGYQLSREAIPAELKERELAERRRRALQDTFFEGRWGEPVKIHA
ncbi:MAG: nitroreductase family protein [Gammaproteobacteria bacterium]|nr:nitroreductase family protein [Gammaproteobacteria bacterium]MCI0590895.1 nitroreductase family protein [Gammaproteobacteria bacterium]